MATPLPQASKSNDNDDGKDPFDKRSENAEVTSGNAKKSHPEATTADTGLPTEIRVKLRKLERLESRYQGRRPAGHRAALSAKLRQSFYVPIESLMLEFPQLSRSKHHYGRTPL